MGGTIGLTGGAVLAYGAAGSVFASTGAVAAALGYGTATIGTEGVSAGATGFQQARQLIQANSNISQEMTKLYRSVGAEVYMDIMGSIVFNLTLNGMESKQFGLNPLETLKFVNWDKSAVAVIETEIPTRILEMIGDFTPVDPGIFKSGIVTIQDIYFQPKIYSKYCLPLNNGSTLQAIYFKMER